MFCDSICFEPDNIDKHIDYNLLLETSYYYSRYPSPTPSTPLSSPSTSLILDDMTVHQHQQSLSMSSTSTVNTSLMAPTVPQQQSLQSGLDGNNDWLLDPFYDVGSFTYQPLAISPAESNQLINAAAESLNCPELQQSMMMMTEPVEFPTTCGLVSPSLSTCTTRENPGTNVNFTDINQPFQFPDFCQQQHYHHQQNIDSITPENSLPLLTASSSKASSQTTVAKPSSQRHLQERGLNIEYPVASTSNSSFSQPVANYAVAPLTNNESTTTVTPIASASISSSSSSSSVTRTPARKKKSHQPSSSSFQCDFPGCQKTFTRPYNLNSHRRTHTNEKPFDCPHCPKTFARQHDRNRHAKLHSGVKPFLCLFCCKSFARQDALSRHQLWSEDHKMIGCSSMNRKNGKESSTTNSK